MKELIKKILPIADVVLFPFVYPAALILKIIRFVGVQYLPLCKKVLLQIGVFPIRNDYYEPLFDDRYIRHPLSENRDLTGIDWNVEEQLSVLNRFQFGNELNDVPLTKKDDLTFYLNNVRFESGDAEYWYNFIRLIKPSKIFEIGSGNSTLMAIKALKKNEQENPAYQCKHICIEPYEMTWLEKTSATIIRKKIEDLDRTFFAELDDNDILFIDSSHIIRPQGDVLFEYLELLPSLRKGVIVHVHDIFSPKDYPDGWIRKEVKFWNEQYLLEAFLTSNPSWKIIGALNYLHHNHYEKLQAKCPFLTPDKNPGSFYIQKIA
jgi:hypothetical protein